LKQIAGFVDKNAGLVDLQVRAVAGSKQMLLGDGPISLKNATVGLSSMDPTARLSNTDLALFADSLRVPGSKAVIVDCTASEVVSDHYASWLRSGVSVVTPNKKAGSADFGVYSETKTAAVSGGAAWMYEATVGAGLPLISTAQSLVTTGDEVHEIEGILSGTLSYIFNTMVPGRKFSDVVRDAKVKGFTEPDPRDDLSGTDVQRKCIILARECGLKLNLEDVPVESLVPEGLRNWEPPAGANLADAFIDALAEYDDEMEARMKAAGGVLRFVGTVDVRNGTAKVGLRAFPADHPFASTQFADNMVVFSTKRYTPRPLVVQGPGAGAAVTAAGVFSDLLHVAGVL